MGVIRKVEGSSGVGYFLSYGGLRWKYSIRVVIFWSSKKEANYSKIFKIVNASSNIFRTGYFCGLHFFMM